MPAVSDSQLPNDCYITISGYDNMYEVYYSYLNKKPYRINNKTLGVVSFALSKDNISKSIYEITYADAQKAYGPLLYDIAMEFVNKITNGKGYLKSDGAAVSKYAQNIWNFYFNRNDVQKKPLDSIQNEVTPTKLDNVYLGAAKEIYGQKRPEQWYNKPLSTAFKKNINLLNSKKILLNVENKIIMPKIKFKLLKEQYTIQHFFEFFQDYKLNAILNESYKKDIILQELETKIVPRIDTFADLSSNLLLNYENAGNNPKLSTIIHSLSNEDEQKLSQIADLILNYQEEVNGTMWEQQRDGGGFIKNLRLLLQQSSQPNFNHNAALQTINQYADRLDYINRHIKNIYKQWLSKGFIDTFQPETVRIIQQYINPYYKPSTGLDEAFSDKFKKSLMMAGAVSAIGNSALADRNRSTFSQRNVPINYQRSQDLMDLRGQVPPEDTDLWSQMVELEQSNLEAEKKWLNDPNFNIKPLSKDTIEKLWQFVENNNSVGFWKFFNYLRQNQEFGRTTLLKRHNSQNPLSLESNLKNNLKNLILDSLKKSKRDK